MLENIGGGLGDQQRHFAHTEFVESQACTQGTGGAARGGHLARIGQSVTGLAASSA
ncbi:hypothetical protein ACHMW6_04960 [Pseudoduganella sp. UC29_106]|uniref:hypothetical protein n=1 Tax=Pseudoduganella sp. UC29_106 TaxID=3374553 RepID=UPI00375716B8